MLNSITLIGSSSGRNAGDAALLSGIMDSIDRETGRRLLYEIPTYRPEYVWKTYENKIRPISMLPWHMSAGMLGIPTYRSIMRSDMTLIFDNMLFDRSLYNPLFNFMSTMDYLLPLAKKKGKILGCYNIGAGPVSTVKGKEMLRKIAELMDFITVRDPDSYELLREIGVKNPNIAITADAALSVKPCSESESRAILETLHFANYPEILGINVNAYLNSWSDDKQKVLTKEEFSAVYAEALDIVSQKLNVPILFVCTQHHDVTITKMILEKMSVSVPKAILSNIAYNHHQIKGVLKKISLLFAMRLHANILCSAALTPTISLAFQKKVTSYYKLLGLQDFVMSFTDFSSESLANHINKGWEAREVIRTTLSQKIPELIAAADRSADIVANIVNAKTPSMGIDQSRHFFNAIKNSPDIALSPVSAEQINR
jgi:polysaccharide pyruvyl transferase WcaK-like protein